MDKHTGNGILEDFRIEFLDCWQRLPNKGFFLALLAAWLLLFQFLGNSTFGYIPSPSLIYWMYMAYQPKGDTAMSDDGHGMLVPFLVLGLFWWRRKELLACEKRTWWPGLLGVALGLLLHVVGYAVQQPRVSIVGLFIGIYGLMGLAWGPAFLRASFFPYWLFCFAVPFGSMGQPITVPLRVLTTRLVEVVCHNILAIDVVRVGTQLTDASGQYHYDVAPACSGIRSLVAIFLMATVYGFLSFRSWWKRGVLIASAFPLAVLGNLVRMLCIVIAAEIGGQKWGNFVHEDAIISLLPYIPAMLGLFYLGLLLERSEPPRDKSSAAGASSRPESASPGPISPKQAPV